MKKILASLFLISMAFSSYAQNGVVKGTIIDQVTKEVVGEATISIPDLKIITTTNGEGEFSFSSNQTGTFSATVSTDGVNEQPITISLREGNNVLAPIEIEVSEQNPDLFLTDISALSIEDASSSDGGGATAAGQNVSSVLSASRDAFLSASTFGWGQFFYRMRGYENDHNILFLNGVPMNELEGGGVFYNSYSGLNDVMRGRSMSLGLAPQDYTFGGNGLNTYIDASASAQRKQTRISYSSTNRNYRNRLMATHSSGLNEKGWAYSVSLSRRWANHGPIKGTYYDAYGYFAAVEKRFKKQSLNLSIIGAPVERGKNGPATREVFDLAGSNQYNPYWGYQNGEVRNSRVFKNHAPLAILTHNAELSKNTRLRTAVSYQSGESSTSNIDWYNVANPRPDYYRYLPSWSFHRGTQEEYEAVKSTIEADPEKHLQIDWDKMYFTNKNQTDGRARYIGNADVEASKKFNANMNISSVVNPNITLQGGALYQWQQNHNFRRVEDLLGGSYFVNVNQFAERDFADDPSKTQLNLLNPNERVQVGDTYGYNYRTDFSKAALFGQAVFNYNRVDFFLAAEYANTAFQRDGLYQHGLYPNSSLGKSVKQSFGTYRAKGGMTFKINGRNYLYANAATGTRAPLVDNVIVSARTRNEMVNNAQTEDMNTIEVGYMLRTPSIKARISGYATDIKGATDITRYFYGDVRSFANLVMQNVNKRYTGIELGSSIKLSSSFSLNLAGSYGQAFFTNRPTAYFSLDNELDDNTRLNASQDPDTAYIQNFNLSAGPQTAFQANLFYRSKKYWFGSLTMNYLARKYYDIAAVNRTVEAVDLYSETNPAGYERLVTQNFMEPFMTMDAFIGKSFKVDKYVSSVSRNHFVYLNLGLTNILNRKDIVLYGFENGRAADGNLDESLDFFADRQAYTLGFQYFLNISYKF